MDLRTVINAELAARCWTKTELARRAGLMVHRVIEYTLAQRDMTGANIDKLLAALELEIRPRRPRRKGK